MDKIKSGFLGLYMISALIFMELVFRYATSSIYFEIGLFISLSFVGMIGFLIYFITTLIPVRFKNIFVAFSMSFFWLIYVSQLIYFKIFEIYYTAYSMTRVGKALAFWKESVSYVTSNILWLLLLTFPIIFFVLYLRRHIESNQQGWKMRLGTALAVMVVYAGSIGLVNIGPKDFQSPYDLYYKSNDIIASVEQLGILTTMRLDIQRIITGWQPKIDLSGLPGGIEELPPTVEYNMLDIDFDRLAAEADSATLKKMHQYFGSVAPTEKNDHTGIYEGYNVIVLTAEGFSPYAVNEELTPTLYKMVHEGYDFKNFYNPVFGVSTSDGEYVANVGLLPKAGVWSFRESSKIELPQVLGNQLKSLGYKTVAYHNHTYDYYDRDLSHPNLGYVYKGIGNGLKVKKVWPASDLEMMQVTVGEYMDAQPFHAYYMTVSGHLNYTFVGNSMAYKNRSLVAGLDMSEQAKAYLACQIELDRAMEYLLKSLRDRGIADKTLIVLSADHYPYGLKKETISEFLGHAVETNFEMYKSNLILYVDGMVPVEVETLGSSLDIIPTVSNLLGLDYDSRLFMGRDIFAPGDPLIIFNNRSFITDKGMYNSKTKAFIPSAGEVVDDGYVKAVSNIINAKFYYSARILETNYFSKLK